MFGFRNRWAGQIVGLKIDDECGSVPSGRSDGEDELVTFVILIVEANLCGFFHITRGCADSSVGNSPGENTVGTECLIVNGMETPRRS